MLAPWRESYDQPKQHIKKQRHYFANKVPSSQSYGFSSSHVWCENWTMKQAEHQRIDAFELWSCRRLLRVAWTSRRSNQSILKEISPEYSFEGLNWCWSWNSNILATWCEELTFGKDPDVGKDVKMFAFFFLETLIFSMMRRVYKKKNKKV